MSLWRLIRSAATHVAVYGLVGPLAFLALLLSPLKRGEVSMKMGWLWGQCILRVAGVRVEVEGQEHLQRDSLQVIVANHQGNFDIYALPQALPVRYRFLVKRELYWFPVFGWALWALGFPGVNRGHARKARAAMERTSRSILERKINLAGFPEGTRFRGPGLLPFKKGLFVVALQLGLPVVPVVISGSRRVQARHAFTVYPGTVRLRFLPPLPTAGLSYKDRDSLIARVRSAIEENLAPEDR